MVAQGGGAVSREEFSLDRAGIISVMCVCFFCFLVVLQLTFSDTWGTLQKESLSQFCRPFSVFALWP